MQGASLFRNADSNKESCEPEVYPNAFEYPYQADAFLTPNAVDVHKKIFIAFRDRIYDAFLPGNSGGDEIWLDIICTIRLHSLQVWHKGLTYNL